MGRPHAFLVLLAIAAGALLIFAVSLTFARPPLRWSSASTWSGGPPIRDGIAHVAHGQTIVLDVPPPRTSQIIVDGTLVLADRDLRIETGSIVVRGTLQAGSDRHPFTHNLSIILDGSSANHGAVEIKNGGRLILYGATKRSWTHLARTVQVAESTITLTDTTGWTAGDRVAIAPSGFNALETEERAAVKIVGNEVHLDTPLRYRHWGTATNGVDERAEVGLLSHNITISSRPTGGRGIGGQVLVLTGGLLQASNVTFEGLGTRGRLGAYPVHFHLAGNAQRSTVESSSIVHSNNRCLTIHGTSNVTVRDNVAFDTVGHCYFFEDGVETANIFDHNLGMLTRVANKREAILESDLAPATFWITNPANVIANNVAAGSQGTGFWYNLSPHPTGPSANDAIWPRRTPLGEFSGNSTHSNENNGLFVDILRNPPGVSEAPNYSPPVVANFHTFTSYKNRRRGAWLRGTNLRLTNATIADNSIGVTFAGANAFLQDSLVVGESQNSTGPPKPDEANFPIRGFEFYDGQVGVERTHFENFISNKARQASALSALQFSPFFTDPTSFARALTFTNAQRVYFQKHIGAKDNLGADGYRGTVFFDADGSVTGKAGASVVLDTPLLAESDCSLQRLWNALICEASYGSVFIIGVNAGQKTPGPVRVAENGRPAFLTLYGNGQRGRDAMFQTNLRSNRGYTITFAKGFPDHLRVGVHHFVAGEHLRLSFPQAPQRLVTPNRMIVHHEIKGISVDFVSPVGNTKGEVLNFCTAQPCG
ncbi:MAG: hypothetical protein NVSMB31_13200 [Vulcanimicrobiaceae bacterium]